MAQQTAAPDSQGRGSEQGLMAGTRQCNSAVIAGRLSKAVEFLDAAGRLEDDMPNVAGDLFVDAGIAASDVICCVRIGVHSSSGTHTEAVALLETALSTTESKETNRAAFHLVEAAKRAVASTGR